MKNKIISLIAAILLIPSLVIAQGGPDCHTGGLSLGNDKYLCAKNATTGANDVQILRNDTSNVIHLNAPSGKSISLEIAKTPVAVIDGNGINVSTGKGEIQPPNTAVFASTAVAGTNVLVPGYNIPGATATANHLVLIGSATAIPGAVYEFYNQSASSLKLKAPAGITLNGVTASGTLVVAAKISATCRVVSATDIDCRLNVNPTAAAA